MTRDEAIKAVDLLIFSLHQQVANHLSDYAMQLTGKMKLMLSGDEFFWKGFKCKVA